MRIEREIIELKQQMQNLIQAFVNFQKEQARTDKETRDNLVKLGAISGLIYSNDINDWVSNEKLTALKKEPR